MSQQQGKDVLKPQDVKLLPQTQLQAVWFKAMAEALVHGETPENLALRDACMAENDKRMQEVLRLLR